jgi:hypothetical protein
MNQKFSDKIIILDYKTRRQEIINFIRNRPGCTRADINNKGQIQIRTGYVTVSRIIKELIKENVIVEKNLNGNKRNKCLYINEKHHLITIPKDLEKFEQSFIQFLNKLKEQNFPTIQVLNVTLYSWLRRYNNVVDKKSNENCENDEKTTLDYLRNFGFNPDIHCDLEELSIQISPFIRALDLFFEFIRLYTSQSIPKFMLEINDKKVCSQLLAIVFDKIASMTIHVKEMLTPILQIVFEKIGTLPSSNVSINLDELPLFYEHFGLRAEVESILNHITRIKISPTQPKFHLPLDEWNLNPLEVDNDVLEEYYNPDDYYNKQLKEELEDYPGELDGIDIIKKYKRILNKSRKKK